jgi:hypothetical protein
MRGNRIFVPQHVLDRWLAEGRVDVQGDELITQPERRRFSLTTAVRFTAEVTGSEDTHQLVGRVKDVAQLAELGAEHYATSVILGDNAYEVVEGFTGAPARGDTALPSDGPLPPGGRDALSWILSAR